MRFVPWQNIADWKCIACGYCCKLYSVVLGFTEWRRIVKNIKRADDGSCSFLCNFRNTYYCGLQNMKPTACKLWPFKVLSEPKYGQARQAAFNYGGRKLFIYADALCSGLRYGSPTWEFNQQTLREFAELALGTRQTQSKTTSKLAFVPHLQARQFSFPRSN
jgi:Fe-S-cluster containining protein